MLGRTARYRLLPGHRSLPARDSRLTDTSAPIGAERRPPIQPVTPAADGSRRGRVLTSIIRPAVVGQPEHLSFGRVVRGMLLDGIGA